MSQATLTPPATHDTLETHSRPLAVEQGFLLASPSRAYPRCSISGVRHTEIDPTRLAVCDRRRAMLSRSAAESYAPTWLSILRQLEEEGLGGGAMHGTWGLGVHPGPAVPMSVSTCVIMRRERAMKPHGPRPVAWNTAMGGTVRGVSQAALSLPELRSISRAMDLIWQTAPRRRTRPAGPDKAAAKAAARERARTKYLDEAADLFGLLREMPHDQRGSRIHLGRFRRLTEILNRVINADASN